MNTCYIIDDDAFAIDLLRGYISKIEDLKLLGAETNPLIGIEEIKCLQPDIIFLDIAMPQLSGLEVVGLVSEKCLIVFTTAHAKYALAAFEKHADGFLLKPFSFDKFCLTYKKIKTRLTPSKNDEFTPEILFVNPGAKGKLTKVEVEDINYIEVQDHLLYIITSKEEITAKLSLKEILSMLPPAGFVQVHRSFIINLSFVDTVHKNKIKLANNTIIPLGESYKKNFSLKLQAGISKY